MTVHFLQFD